MPAGQAQGGVGILNPQLTISDNSGVQVSTPENRMAFPLMLALMIVATSALTAGAVLLAAQAWQDRQARRRADGIHQDDPHGRAGFVFHDRRMLDCNTRGQALLATARAAHASPPQGDDLEPLLRFLTPHFPGMRGSLAQLATRGALSMTAADDSGLQLDAEWRAGLAHIHVTDTRAAGSSIMLDRLSFDALEAELQSLRQCTEKAPFLIWHQDSDDAVTWANGAYLELAARQDHDLVWPLPVLFPAASDPETPRLCLQLEDRPCWFQHHHLPIANGTLHYAIPVEAGSQQDSGRRDLMQTLAGAFATHQVGLAVFDRARVLQIFNPALVDMTGLEPEFLIARPRFDQVLHCLRERRLLPEPADYRSWRNALLEMERAAETGAYHEEWALPSGQTFHVTGRPHPDGGIAFLFEDVTSEITLTRSFRAQIETAQSVIDAMPQAMAVFSPQGTLTLANAAYHRLWGSDPEEVAARINLQGALQGWRARSQPSPLWDALASLTERRSEDGAIRGSAVLRNGQILSVHTTALEGRNTLVTFEQAVGAQRQGAAGAVPPPHLHGQSLTAAAPHALPETMSKSPIMLAEAPRPQPAIHAAAAARASARSSVDHSATASVAARTGSLGDG